MAFFDPAKLAIQNTIAQGLKLMRVGNSVVPVPPPTPNEQKPIIGANPTITTPASAAFRAPLPVPTLAPKAVAPKPVPIIAPKPLLTPQTKPVPSVAAGLLQPKPVTPTQTSTAPIANTKSGLQTLADKVGSPASAFGALIKADVKNLKKGFQDVVLPVADALTKQSPFRVARAYSQATTPEEKQKILGESASAFSMGAAEEGAVAGKVLKPLVSKAAQKASSEIGLLKQSLEASTGPLTRESVGAKVTLFNKVKEVAKTLGLSPAEEKAILKQHGIDIKLSPVEAAIQKAGGIGKEYTGDAVRATQEVPKAVRPPRTPDEILEEGYKITSDVPEKRPALKKVAKDAADKVYDSVVAEFEPLARAEKAIHAARGSAAPELSMAKRFELQAGAAGKAESDIRAFSKHVIDPIRDVQEDFNVYLYFKRAKDRIQTDAEKRAVGSLTAQEAQSALDALQTKLGPERYAQFNQIGSRFQQLMDQSLRLQVQSGRLSPEMYAKIKSMNDFYAPYKVLKFIEGDALVETAKGVGAGTGRNIATTEDLTKAIKGIKDDEFRIGNILNEASKQIFRSRILAEKNLKMTALAELGLLDKTGEFIKKAKLTRYFQVEHKPAEAILHQLSYQAHSKNPQLLEQSFIKVGRALQLADEVGIPITKVALPHMLDNATLGGIETGGRVKLKTFISDVITHELAHIFDTKTGNVTIRRIFGKDRAVIERLSSFVNGSGFKGELRKLIDFTHPNADPNWSSQGVEKFAEFVSLYIHDPAKARELAPNFTDFFELKLLPENKIKVLVDRLADFYHKVDGLPNIKTDLEALDNHNYLETAIRRAFPDKKPQLAVSFGSKARAGYKNVSYLDRGIEKSLEVRADLAQAIEGMDAKQTGLIAQFLGKVAGPFRFGATAGNIAFQGANALIFDQRRLLQMSKYGFKSPVDFIRYPLDWVQSVSSSILGNVFGKNNELYDAWLKSGAANSTIQRSLTPQAFARSLGGKPLSIKRPVELTKAIAQTVLDTPAKIANALEEGTKITGLKRGLRIERVKLSEVGTEAVASKMEKIASEVRNYAGSPDFARKGSLTPQSNLLFMFSNARIQGVDADMARLFGKTGKEAQRSAWLKYMATTGVASTYLGLVNRLPGNREDYEKRPAWERDNYFLIPMDTVTPWMPKYVTTESGEQVRNYWRVPKRETDQYTSNVMDSLFDFAVHRDPKAFVNVGTSIVEGLAPVNVTGNTLSERVESIVSSVNPAIKVGAEFATGRDTFRHKDIIPLNLRNIEPKKQYTKTTNPLYVKAGELTGQSPLKIEAVSKGLFASGFSQFSPNAPEGNRSKLSTAPFFSRFYSAPYTANDTFWDKVNAAQSKADTASILVTREAESVFDTLKGKSLEQQNEILRQTWEKDQAVSKKLEKVIEEHELGIGPEERAMRDMNVKDGTRARFIIDLLKDRAPGDLAKQNEIIKRLWEQKVISKEVMKQIQSGEFNQASTP